MASEFQYIYQQEMNNIDQLYTAHGQGIQPLYDEASGKTPAFTYNNILQAVNNGYVPVFVGNYGGALSYANVYEYGMATGDSPEYIAHLSNLGNFVASSPDDYLTYSEEGGAD